MRQNDLSVIRWYAKTISAEVENTRNSQLFAFIEVASEYVKTIFAHIENTSEEKSTWKIHQEQFVVFSLCANWHKLEPILAIFLTRTKNIDPRSSFYVDRMEWSKKLSHATVPLLVHCRTARFEIQMKYRNKMRAGTESEAQ
jgi:hypothetical protein